MILVLPAPPFLPTCCCLLPATASFPHTTTYCIHILLFGLGSFCPSFCALHSAHLHVHHCCFCSSFPQLPCLRLGFCTLHLTNLYPGFHATCWYLYNYAAMPATCLVGTTVLMPLDCMCHSSARCLLLLLVPPTVRSFGPARARATTPCSSRAVRCHCGFCGFYTVLPHCSCHTMSAIPAHRCLHMPVTADFLFTCHHTLLPLIPHAPPPPYHLPLLHATTTCGLPCHCVPATCGLPAPFHARYASPARHYYRRLLHAPRFPTKHTVTANLLWDGSHRHYRLNIPLLPALHT